MLRTKAVVLIAGTLLSVPLSAQTLEGPKTRVNARPGSSPFISQVAAAANGDFAVVWEDEGSTGPGRIWVRRFSARGQPQGRETPVDTSSPKMRQSGAQIAMAAGGNFMVVWNLGDLSTRNRVFGRCFAADGKPRGNAFRLNPDSQDPLDLYPAIAAAPDGSFVTTWMSGPPYPYDDILARRFTADGKALSPAFKVVSPAELFQSAPRVAVSGSGEVLIGWLAYGEGLGDRLLARRFDAGDHPLGDSFQAVPGTLDRPDYRFSMATAENGESLFVWLTPDIGAARILGQRCAADGTRLGEPFVIHDGPAWEYSPPAVATIPGGGYFVAWGGPLSSTFGVFGKTLPSDGAPQGSDLLIDSGSASYTSLSIGGNRKGIVTWTAFTPRSSTLFFQRFDPLH